MKKCREPVNGKRVQESARKASITVDIVSTGATAATTAGSVSISKLVKNGVETNNRTWPYSFLYIHTGQMDLMNQYLLLQPHWKTNRYGLFGKRVNKYWGFAMMMMIIRLLDSY